MLPAWAVVVPERRAHIERVAALLAQWAEELRVAPFEAQRWLKAAWYHDALRDAPLGGGLEHGPLAADRMSAEGEDDQGVLDAVRWHSVGYAGWDDAGRMLYLADYLEPGRRVDAAFRAELATRVVAERDAVLVVVARRRIARAIESGWPLPVVTAEFWNDLVRRVRP